jgi:hypothetical protein
VGEGVSKARSAVSGVIGGDDALSMATMSYFSAARMLSCGSALLHERLHDHRHAHRFDRSAVHAGAAPWCRRSVGNLFAATSDHT